jgi:hypothetical protein
MSSPVKISPQYEVALKEVEPILSSMGFKPHPYNQGYPYYIKYKHGDTIIMFMYGPSDWHVEIVLFTAKGKFNIADLMKFPTIADWVYGKKFISSSENPIVNELLWNIELMKIALLFIE